MPADPAASSRRTGIIVGVCVAVVVVAILLFAVLASGVFSSKEASPASPSPSGSPASTQVQALPKGVSATGDYALAAVPDSFNPKVPTLVLWEDFQCPGCGALERMSESKAVQQMAQSGTLNVIYRPVAFLDANLGNDSSARAQAAYGCALDAGVGLEFHNEVFANQPAQEGAGYTDAQLKSFAAAAGLSGSSLDSFTSCVDAGTYRDWPAASTQLFFDSKAPGTPYALLDGKPVDIATIVDTAAFAKLVSAATAARSSSSAAAS